MNSNHFSCTINKSGLEQLRQIVQTTLREFAAIPTTNRDTQDRLIFDAQTDSYQWQSLGWKEMQRTFNVVLHIEIRNNLVWIERNASSIEIGDVLAEHGIPRKQIVLGFHAPYKRGLHGFATGET